MLDFGRCGFRGGTLAAKLGQWICWGEVEIRAVRILSVLFTCVSCKVNKNMIKKESCKLVLRPFIDILTSTIISKTYY